jgi:hypothetical protein
MRENDRHTSVGRATRLRTRRARPPPSPPRTRPAICYFHLLMLRQMTLKQSGHVVLRQQARRQRRSFGAGRLKGIPRREGQ